LDPGLELFDRALSDIGMVDVHDRLAEALAVSLPAMRPPLMSRPTRGTPSTLRALGQRSSSYTVPSAFASRERGDIVGCIGLHAPQMDMSLEYGPDGRSPILL
jgi:hypothetical protein